VIREEVVGIPDQPAILASGPLTSPALAKAIQALSGEGHLFFYDAIAPIVSRDSIDFSVVFRGSRYGRGDREAGDYINCPLDEQEYGAFIDALLLAQRIELHDFELSLEQGVRAGAGTFFEGCLPVEVLAQRGRQALAFGPMRPVGLEDVRTGKRPYAVLQLRQDNLAGSLYNLVGFQTNLTYAEQKRVFRMIPGLEKAEFVRYGQMHRNTFINSPVLLSPTLQYRRRDDLFFAGQITGVEGYAGNFATGLVAGWNAARVIQGKTPSIFPETTQIGALCHYVTSASEADFQPMKANFGILPLLEGPKIRDKRRRQQAYVERGMRDLESFLATLELPGLEKVV
jgi:methylenetetrahydrofolate--tRNA-(uracil-5-)-methyltransferase